MGPVKVVTQSDNDGKFICQGSLLENLNQLLHPVDGAWRASGGTDQRKGLLSGVLY